VRKKGTIENKSSQFNMRLTDDMRRKLDQLAVNATIKKNKLVTPSEVVRSLIDEAFARQRRV
jgi:predicted transcriptional regulator